MIRKKLDSSPCNNHQYKRKSAMKKTAIRLVITAIVVYCTIEALYWPIIMKPGTELYWWQNKLASQVGYYVGIPILVTAAKSPFTGLDHVAAIWFSVAVWGAIIYYLSGYLISLTGYFKKNESRSG
jgi:cation transport ATPase